MRPGFKAGCRQLTLGFEFGSSFLFNIYFVRLLLCFCLFNLLFYCACGLRGSPPQPKVSWYLSVAPLNYRAINFVFLF